MQLIAKNPLINYFLMLAFIKTPAVSTDITRGSGQIKTINERMPEQYSKHLLQVREKDSERETERERERHRERERARERERERERGQTIGRATIQTSKRDITQFSIAGDGDNKRALPQAA
jgi:Ni/Co efflux regulator RcnB